MRRLEEQYPEELVVIGVHSAKFPSEHVTENIRQAVLRLGIHHPVVNDTGFRIWDEYAVRGWPTLVLVDPNGRIADQTSGEILAEEYVPKINELIQLNPDTLRRGPLPQAEAGPREGEDLLRYPAKLLLAPGNILFIADTGHNRVLRVALNSDGTRGEITEIYGSGRPGLRDGGARDAQLNHPHGLALRGSIHDGTLYVADTENHAIRAVDLASGEVRTAAGTGQKAHGSFRLGNPREVPLRSPWALAALEQYLFIAMAGSHQIWVLIDEQQIGPFAGTGAEALVDGPLDRASFNQPSDLAHGMGHLFVADAEASAIRAISLDESTQVITLVGQGLFEFGDKDGAGAEVRLQHPTGLSLEEDLLYIADTYNHKIKVLDPTTGEVTTLAGSGEPGLVDGSFGQTRFYEPEGLQAVGGKIFVADTNNHAVRCLDLDLRRTNTLLLFYRAGLSSRPESAERLEPVVVPPGVVRLTLDPVLPPGTKRNPDGEATVAVGGAHPHVYRFAPEQALSFEVDVSADTDLPLGVALLYCEQGEASLCRVDNRDLILPVKIQPGAAPEARIQYAILTE